jgi:hypothetical protein
MAARACVITIAQELRSIVVAIDVGQVRKQLMVRIEVVSEDGLDVIEPLEVMTLEVELDQALAEALRGLAGKLKVSLRRSDAPLATAEPVLVPSPSKGETKVDPLPASPPGKGVAKWVVGGSGLATSGAAIGLGVASIGLRRDLEATFYDTPSGRATTLTQAQLDQRTATTNGLVAGAVVSAVVSAALLGTATYLFLAE